MMYKFCLAMLIAFAVPSIASAGGGNTKSTGTITFKNTSATQDVYLVLSADRAFVTSTTIANFSGRGRVLGPNESTSYTSLKSSRYHYGFLATPTGVVPTSLSGNTIRSTNVAGGQTVNINLP